VHDLAVLEPITIGVEDPRRDEVRALLDRHLNFARATSPACHVHPLDPPGLLDPSMTFVAGCRGGVPVGVGALEERSGFVPCRRSGATR
jgi:putative acetyltransferase